MKWYELMDDGNGTYAVGPFDDPDEGSEWAIENETGTVTSRGAVAVMSRRAWKQHQAS